LVWKSCVEIEVEEEIEVEGETWSEVDDNGRPYSPNPDGSLLALTLYWYVNLRLNLSTRLLSSLDASSVVGLMALVADNQRLREVADGGSMD
jgi:hypothetical protein